MLSGYAKREWGTILAIGLMLTLTFAYVGLWWLAGLAAAAATALLLFFRDPPRRVPSQRGVMVSPADGRISSIHHLDHFEPFGEGATCIRVFLSVLDVHVNRVPCHGIVQSILHKPGRHLNALKPESAEENEAVLMVLQHPIKQQPVAAVRQVAGLLARTVVCAAREGQVLQRGQRYGIIKFGSTTEVYIPDRAQPQVMVQQGQYVYGGLTVLAEVQPQSGGAPRPDEILQKAQREARAAALEKEVQEQTKATGAEADKAEAEADAEAGAVAEVDAEVEAQTAASDQSVVEAPQTSPPHNAAEESGSSPTRPA